MLATFGAVLLVLAAIPPASSPLQETPPTTMVPLAWAVLVLAANLQPRDHLIVTAAATDPLWLYLLNVSFGSVLDWLSISYTPAQERSCFDPSFSGGASCFFNYLAANNMQPLVNRTISGNVQLTLPDQTGQISGDVSLYAINAGTTETVVSLSGTISTGVVAPATAASTGGILMLAAVALGSPRLARALASRRSLG